MYPVLISHYKTAWREISSRKVGARVRFEPTVVLTENERVGAVKDCHL